MSEYEGKLLREGLPNIKKKFFRVSGKKKISPWAFRMILAMVLLFSGWSYLTTHGYERVKPSVSYQKQTENAINMQVGDIVQSTNMAMTMQAKEEMFKLITPTVVNTPVELAMKLPEIQEDIKPTLFTDVMETGLDPNEVMQVLRNLPAQGRFRMDGINESVVSTKNFKISFYWPPYGGINCSGKYNCAYTASGKRALEGTGYYAACPPDMPFGTKLVIFNKEWICEDRGSAIVDNWLDLLYPYMPYGLAWSTEVTVKIIGQNYQYATITTTPIPQYPTITMTPELVYPTITKTYLNTLAYTPTVTKTIETTFTNTPSPTYTISPEISPTITE